MKKLFVIVLAAIGMVSCMNTDEVIEVNNDNAIAFADAFIENSVRAEITTADLTQFNVWGWMEDTEGSDVKATVFEGREVTNTDGAGWTYRDPQYWVPGFKYHFQALSSNLAEADRNWGVKTVADREVKVVSFENVDGTEDLIYATAADVKAPALGDTAQPVELEFNHQLAKVKFTLAYDDKLSAALGNGMSVKADSIKMDVPKTGVLNLVSGDWSVGAETTTLEMKVSDESASDERLTIPAENYTYAISFDVNLYKGGVKVKKLVTKTACVVLDVVKGCAYNFTAKLTPENLQMDSIDFTPEVGDWNQGGNAGFEPSVAVVSDAFNLIKSAGDEDIKNIVLNNDINLDDYISRADDEFSPSITVKGELTIDLAGHNISGRDKGTASFGLINVTSGASLNVINSADVDGKISLTAVQNRGWNAYSSVISNQCGTLTVGEGVVIEHLGGTDMAYGIDNLTNGKGTSAITTINGGTIKSTYRAVRMFLNGIEAQNTLTVNGGVIEGANKSIWMQDPSANANTGKLTVAADAELKGDVYLFVCAGSTEWPVEVSLAKAALKGESEVITGNVPAGYAVVLENGVYKVVNSATAATADELRAAIKAKEEVISLVADIELDKVLEVGYSVTILGNDHTLTTSATRAIRLTTSDINVEINDLNIVSNAPMNWPNDVRGISIDGGNGFKDIKLTLNDCTIDFADSTTCDWTYAVNIVGNTNAYKLTINGGTYEGANVVNVWGNNHNININGATLDSKYKPNQYYSGCCVRLEGVGNTVTIKNTTFNSSGGNAIAVSEGSDAANNIISHENNVDNTVQAKE